MKNIGIFIDGENINPKDYTCIYEEISTLGRIIVSRVYADWSSSLAEKWNELAMNYALEMIHCAKLPRKNSVDIRIIDDIYEFLYETQTVDKFYLISTDADFITPARRVRRKGKEFYGVGYSNSSILLKKVCDKFIPIEMLRKNDYETDKKKPRRQRKKEQSLLKKGIHPKTEESTKDVQASGFCARASPKRACSLSLAKQEQKDKEEEQKDKEEYYLSSSESEYDDFYNEKYEIKDILEETIENNLPINSLEYLEKYFPQGLRYIKLKNLFAIISEKREDFNLSIEEFKNELEKNDKLLILPNKFEKLTVYNMSSLNDDNSTYLWEQINKILEKNDSKMLISILKENLEKQTLIFDQRIWGFNKIKEWFKICFPNRYEFTENEIILL